MLNETFQALSDPTRRAILGLLVDRERSVNELVDQFDLTQSTVSRHLQVLERAHLITRRRDGQRRLCALATESLAEVDEWMETYRRFWSERLDRLDKVVSDRSRQ